MCRSRMVLTHRHVVAQPSSGDNVCTIQRSVCLTGSSELGFSYSKTPKSSITHPVLFKVVCNRSDNIQRAGLHYLGERTGHSFHSSFFLENQVVTLITLIIFLINWNNNCYYINKEKNMKLTFQQSLGLLAILCCKCCSTTIDHKRAEKY